MKTLTITIEKGGTGKSLIATQFAFYAQKFFGLRVAVIDLDQQQQTAETLVRSGRTQKAEVSSADFFTQKTADVIREVSSRTSRSSAPTTGLSSASSPTRTRTPRRTFSARPSMPSRIILTLP